MESPKWRSGASRAGYRESYVLRPSVRGDEEGQAPLRVLCTVTTKSPGSLIGGMSEAGLSSFLRHAGEPGTP